MLNIIKSRCRYLKLAITGENADPFVIIVSNDDVTIGVHSDTSWALKLSW